ncbi:MAG TPA: UvrD-helicase domain-containing protein [bacterium]|jgi:DNA helicase-2/ATP-dependent DNA helicase PcrA|nr:UvrD-helicase domain-containing protein [bacterium]HOG38338.1 UvrD-helicase domain-containing protein [bacterium]HQI03240.1 UvrD-helicase domain-containing protein [bacterium]
MNTQDIKLNTQQKKAIEYGDGPLLIVAGAGTGKTTVLTQRVYHLIKSKNLKPENVLALTFTEKAATEMEERIDRMLPYGYSDLWVMTFHGFCQKILEESGINIGLPSNFRVLDETSAWMLIRKNLDKFDLDYYRPLGNPTKFIKDLIKHFSRCKDELISPEIYLDYAEKLRLNKDLTNSDEAEFEIKRIEELANAYHTYQNVLLENDVLDFGDLINYTIKLFKERPNILEKYKKQFEYILVDEFQDTNHAQYELIKILASPKNNITVVGDDDQSIYAFRGSSMNNILGFKKDYKNAQEIFIVDNYRSTQDILDLAYGFIELNNPNRLEVKLSEFKKGKEKLDKKLVAHSKEKGEIETIVSDNEEDEAQDVLEKIYEIIKRESGISWNDFAILVRSNSQAKPFIRSLDDAGIPYNFVASSGLYEKEIIMDIISYLKLLDDYHESTALWRVLNFKFFDIDHKDLVNLSHTAKKKAVSLFEVIKNHFRYIKLSAKTTEILDKVVGLIEKHTKMSLTKKVWIVIWEFLDDSGYLKYIDSLKESEKQEIFSHLNQFYKKVKNFERDDINGRVKDFLEFFTLETESGEKGKLQNATDDGPESVKIMTVHGSKGLEFDYVFICGLVDKRFPSIERSETIPIPDDLVKEQVLEGDVHLEEERRLFYVAMTRARKGLYFTRARDYGGVKAKKPSRFLQELNLVKIEEEFIRDNASIYDKFSKRDDVKKIDKEDLKKLLPKQYSFSQIAAYDKCPRQYYYAHILKIPSMGKYVFSFGKSMHLALQKFFQLHNARISVSQTSIFDNNKEIEKNKIAVSLDEFIAIYEENFIDDWYEDEINKKKYFELGKKLLKDIYKKYENNPPKVKYLEKGFNIKIADYSFKGNIDRVDEVSGGVELIDYKTGKPKSKLSFEEKQQLIIYQIAYESVFKEKVKNLKFHYLEDNSEVDFLGTEKDKEKAQNKILEIIKKINSCDFKPNPSEHTCKYCDFNNICPFRE